MGYIACSIWMVLCFVVVSVNEQVLLPGFPHSHHSIFAFWVHSVCGAPLADFCLVFRLRNSRASSIPSFFGDLT
jgi:hypothetical protein